jgi:N-acetylglucosamine-6-phosphate deacetylase
MAQPSKNTFVINVESLITENEILRNQTVAIKNGIIHSVSENQNKEQRVLAGTLVPGFIDLQVNGGGGCLFNQTPNLNSIQIIANAHQQFGTTGWFPTLVTDSIDKMQQAADAVSMAYKDKSLGVLGIHFEGPHISESKKGVHSSQFIRDISQREIELYLRKDLGQVIVTVAPESVSSEMISKLTNEGVIVCIGHSNASFEQAQKAIIAGATGFTHLFNAMSQFNSRAPGMVGAALLNKEIYYGLILDGIHVHPEAANLAINMNPNMMLVTDAMPIVASSEQSFDFFGQLIKREGNQLSDKEGRLAGSSLDMATAVRNSIKMLNLSLVQAVKLASFNPAKFLAVGHQYGDIKVGQIANMVMLNNEFEVVSSWINGEEIN